MPRKRKVPVVNEENADPDEKVAVVTKKVGKNDKQNKKQKLEPDWASGDGLNVIKVILSVQKSDCNANKCTNELTKLYQKMDHKPFMASLNRLTQIFLIRDDGDEIATRVLKYIGNFVASFGEEVDEATRETHPIIQDLLREILQLSANDAHVRVRLCSLVTHIMSSFSQKAELDESIIENITDRMLYFMKDVAPSVRAQAVLALQRLQDPDNPDDLVTKAYIYHMESDPVSKVRQATLSAIAKKIQNMPSLIERLRDVDEKVRRHCYLQLATFSVKSYKIVDRISILNNGLNDRSDIVKKAVVNILLANWIGVYDYDYAELIRAIKIDSCEKELVKFRKLADQTLTEVFKKRKLSDMIAYLNLNANTEFKNCLTLGNTTLEMLLVWKAVAKFHQDYMEGRGGTRDVPEDSGDEEEQNHNETISNIEIMPELSIFCDYMTKIVSDFVLGNETDAKLSKIYFSQCIVVLLEIVQMNDLGDEIGKGRLQELLKKILLEYEISEFAIHEITRVIVQIVPNTEARLQFFNSIVIETVKIGTPSEDRRQSILNDLINKSDIDRKIQAKGITLRLMDLKEQETVFVEKKQYAECQRVQEEAEALNTELIQLLKPVAEAQSIESVHQLTLLEHLSTTTVKKLTPAETLKTLRICYYAITSKDIRQITHDVLAIYNEFVRYHLESNDIMIRIWALKTATAYSLLYESIAKDVFYILKSQIFRHAHVLIWECAIECIVDLLLRYSIEKMDNFNNLDGTNVSVSGVPSMSGLINCSQNRSRRGGRTLYTDAEGDEDDEFDEGNIVKNLDIMQMLLHVIEQNVDKRIHKVTIVGICKLILHGVYCTRDIIAKFLIMFFNPVTDAEISQILGVFLENIVRKKKQEYLHDALQPTIFTLFEAPHDSPLRDVKLDTVLKYIVGATRPIFCSNGLNLHNTLAMKFLEFMQENNEAKDILKIFSKELLDLEIGEDPLLKKDITKKVDVLIKDSSADQRTKKYLVDFRSMLNGTYKVPLKFSSTARVTTAIPEEEEGLEIIDEENEEENANAEKPTEQSIKEPKEDSPELDETPANVSTNLSPSKRKLLDVSVTIPKIKKDETLENETMTEDVQEIPASPEHLEIPATQVVHLEIPATQEMEESKVEDEEDISVLSSDDEIPATPITPVTVKPKRQRANQTEEFPPTPTSRSKPTNAKRVLEISHSTPATPSVSSPLRKARKSVTPSTSQPSTSTPKASKSESRMTRKQAREEMALQTTMTRSASKYIKSTSKIVEEKKVPAKSPQKAPAKALEKVPAKAPEKAPAKNAPKSKLPLQKTSATTSKAQSEVPANSRPTRTRAGDSQTQAKKPAQAPARPRWK